MSTGVSAQGSSNPITASRVQQTDQYLHEFLKTNRKSTHVNLPVKNRSSNAADKSSNRDFDYWFCWHKNT